MNAQPRLALGMSFADLVNELVTDLDPARCKRAGSASPVASLSVDHGGLKIGEAAGALFALTPAQRTRMVEALEPIMTERLRALDKGHTLDRDLGRDEGEAWLLKRAATNLNDARDDVRLRVGGRDWRGIAIGHLARSAALVLACIELLLERQAQEQLEPEPAPIEQGNLAL